MVLREVNVADNVVVYDCVFARPVEPRLLLGVVGPVLQPLQLVAEVENVVGLLIPEGTVLVLGEHFDRVLLLYLLDLGLSLRVGERLRDRIVLDFLALYKLACDLPVWLSLALEVLLGLVVRGDVPLPFAVAVLESHCSICVSESVTSRHF